MARIWMLKQEQRFSDDLVFKNAKTNNLVASYDRRG
jgi:hypothetical protein